MTTTPTCKHCDAPINEETFLYDPPNKGAEAEFMKREIHQILTRRYGNVTIAETIGVLQMVQFEVLQHLSRQGENSAPL